MDGATTQSGNPLLDPWQAPFGLPPFASVKPEHFAPAFAHALQAHRAEVEAIAGARSAPSMPAGAN